MNLVLDIVTTRPDYTTVLIDTQASSCLLAFTILFYFLSLNKDEFEKFTAEIFPSSVCCLIFSKKISAASVSSEKFLIKAANRQK